VYFGGLRRYKRPSVAVGLTHLLRRTGFDVKLIFVGEGPMLEDIRRLSQELGVSESIDFVGRVDDAELSRIVAASWVNVHTSVSEGWGFSISEAAACGTPTVAFSVPGVSESVGNGITGILAQDGDTTALAEACASILKEPEPWFSRCKLEGRRRPWDIVAADWEHYLKLVMTEE
jgi:glycosyltransferase involved in cell wall biosynthesis